MSGKPQLEKSVLLPHSCTEERISFTGHLASPAGQQSRMWILPIARNAVSMLSDRRECRTTQGSPLRNIAQKKLIRLASGPVGEENGNKAPVQQGGKLANSGEDEILTSSFGCRHTTQPLNSTVFFLVFFLRNLTEVATGDKSIRMRHERSSWPLKIMFFLGFVFSAL